MQKIMMSLLSIALLSGPVLAAVVKPVPPEETQPAGKNEPVRGLIAAASRADGTALPDINGKLSLQDCIDVALANSTEMVSAELQRQSANVNLNLSKGNFLPTASAGASQSYNGNKTKNTPYTDHGSRDIYAQASLSISGITDLAREVKMKGVEVSQAQLNVEKVKNERISAVKKNYYALLSALRKVAIRTKSRDVYKDQYERTAEYYRLGLRPKVDVTTAEVNLNNEELNLIRAKNQIKTASASLANVMGITTPKILDIDENIVLDDFTQDFDTAVKTAYENRPDVQSALLDVRLSEMKLSKAKWAYLPTLSFSAGFEKSGENLHLDNENTRLYAGIDIPIFNAFKTYNGVKQAKITLESTQNSTRSLLNNVFLDVQNAYIKMQEAAESIPLAELNAEKANENLQLAQGRYNEGIGDMIELKDAEVAYTDAELNLLTARYDYASAVADLKKAMGTY